MRALAYVLEDELIYVYDTPGDGRRPLHRYFSEGAADHFYTTLGDGGSIAGYVYEGIACYVYGAPGDNRVRLFRLWNGTSLDHGYTTRASSAPGYVAEPWEHIWVYDNLSYYGFFYSDSSASDHDLAQLRQWTNTGFASSLAQLRRASCRIDIDNDVDQRGVPPAAGPPRPAGFGTASNADLTKGFCW